MEAKTIVTTEVARRILREFNAPSYLLQESELVDIINRTDAIVYLYITKLREESEPSECPPDEGSISHLTEAE